MIKPTDEEQKILDWYSHKILGVDQEGIIIKDGIGTTFKMPFDKAIAHIKKDHKWGKDTFNKFLKVVNGLKDRSKKENSESLQSELINRQDLRSYIKEKTNIQTLSRSYFS